MPEPDLRRPFISPIEGKLLTGFRDRYYDNERSAYYRHTGIDLAGDPGEKIMASGNGIVSYTGFSPTGGRTVVIRHNSRIRTTYLNLSSIFVNKGDIVRQGDIIASIGASDDPSRSECHLHFAIIYENTYLDPEMVLRLDYSNISLFLRLYYSGRDYLVY